MPIRPENRARYPVDWKTISLKIKTRAEWCCECRGECGIDHEGRCGAEHRAQNERGSTVILTTAHLDHQPENCAPENLRAMCQRCHLRYDRDHHRETRQKTRASASPQMKLIA